MPVLKGVCLKVGTTKPKKPNSAARKTVKVRLSTGRVATAYIPSKGHNVQQHRPGATKDVRRSGATQLNLPVGATLLGRGTGSAPNGVRTQKLAQGH